MYSFVSADELKAYPLPVKDAQWNLIETEQIEEVLEGASEHVRDYLERDIEPLEYIERIQGTGSRTLMVNNYPIISIESVSRQDVHGYESSYGAEEFLVDAKAGLIEWVDKYRNHWFQNYLWTIEYTAGYLTIPKPIKHATMLVAVQMLQPLFRGGTNFQSIDLMDDSNEHIVDMLERYRRVRIG